MAEELSIIGKIEKEISSYTDGHTGKATALYNIQQHIAIHSRNVSIRLEELKIHLNTLTKEM